MPLYGRVDLMMILFITVASSFYFVNFVCYGLSTITPSPPNVGAKLVKRIAIIGSGISGLAVTHALINNSYRKDSQNNIYETIDIFDSRTTFDHTAGAGIQLNGGLSILGKINPTLQTAVYNAGLKQTQIESRTNPWFINPMNGNDNKKYYDTLLQLDLQQIVERAGKEIADSLLLSNNTDHNNNNNNSETKQKQLLWISIMRGALQRVLYETLPQNRNRNWKLQFQKKLVNIRSPRINDNEQNEDGVVYCQFADGSESGPYDLIIGCEGINSVVKQYIECNGQIPETSKITDGIFNTQSAIYSGLRIRYAIADDKVKTTIDKPKTSKLTQFFGNGAYALHGKYGNGMEQSSTQCAFIVYLDKNYIGPFKRKKEASSSDLSDRTSTATIKISENADWTQDRRGATNVARQRMLDQLDQCNIPTDSDDTIRTTIRNADRFFELGSYYHNPFGSWSYTVPPTKKNGSYKVAHVVLCGDAAHALPPFLGQGSNQAIQDAYCLAEKIVEYNTKIQNENETAISLQELLNDYQSKRWYPCFQIFWKAIFLGYLETGGINGYYSKFRDVFFRSMGIIGVASNVLLNAATPKV
jgi:salicylate hydroxylase